MSASTTPLLAAIADLLAAPERARPADAGDAVAGVMPRVVAEPANEAEVAALLAHAEREGLKVLVRGGGTQLDLGFPPAGGDLLLSLARLDQVVEHAPHDLTVTVQAGMPLAALQAALAPAGQWLALDPALPVGATVGGLIATNASGPRRLRYGGVRDQILGVRVALAGGSVVKGGGKVVKNVAGYDLPKLYTGALGTLGVVVAATFRLYPLPAASRTVALTVPDPAPLGALAQEVTASTLEPTILDISSASGGACTCAARFETVAAAAEQQAE
ncbi:MAG TPA: FAD-binding oxidoreductase, partial [Ktedonobacterales bacterium]